MYYFLGSNLSNIEMDELKKLFCRNGMLNAFMLPLSFFSPKSFLIVSGEIGADPMGENDMHPGAPELS